MICQLLDQSYVLYYVYRFIRSVVDILHFINIFPHLERIFLCFPSICFRFVIFYVPST